MSKKESENDRYNRMKKIERESIIEKFKNEDYYEDYSAKKKKLSKYSIKNTNNLTKYKKNKNLNYYDDYDYI